MKSFLVGRRDAAMVVACAVGLIAFGFRLLTLRNLPNDHFMHLVWAQQVLFGDLPGRDFVDPGMPLTYVLSALVQYVWPGPFSETMLTLVLLSAASWAITLLAIRLSGSVTVGATAGVFAILIRPRLYGYPKVLVPAVALLLFDWYERAPSRRRLCGMAAWVALGVLFRHDLGAIAAVAVVSGLVASDPPDWRALAVFVTATAAALFPYAAYVALTEGIVEHLAVGWQFANTDAHQVVFTPTFPWTRIGTIAEWSAVDSGVLLSYMSRAFVPLGFLWLAIRGRNDAALATKVALLVVLGFYGVVILRHPFGVRISDLAAPLAVAIAWVGGGLIRQSMMGRRLLTVLSAAAGLVLTIGTTVLAADVGHFGQRLLGSRANRGLRNAYETFTEVRRQGTNWPWTWFWPQGELPEITRYVNQCTAPTDRLLVTWFGPEFYYFARRPFGGGVGVLYPGRAFKRPHDQERMVARMRQERIPIVLTNDDRGPVSGYPLLEEYLAREYESAGSFTMYDDTRVTIMVRRDLKAAGTYGADHWPCFEPADPLGLD